MTDIPFSSVETANKLGTSSFSSSFSSSNQMSNFITATERNPRRNPSVIHFVHYR